MFQIPGKSPALSSFYDLLSPAPSTCSVESTEALLRDLVDVYSEPITSPLREYEEDAYSQQRNSTYKHEEPVEETDPSINQLVDECFPPHVEQALPHTVPQQTSPQNLPPLPFFPSCPTGGPPETAEPPILSVLSPRSEPLANALLSECTSNILPLNLIQAVVSQETQLPTLTPLSTRSTSLQTSLLMLRETHKTKADQLHLFFQLQAARLESDRANHLCTSTQTPTLLPAVNQYFDMQHHALIDNIELQIHCLRYQFSPKDVQRTCSPTNGLIPKTMTSSRQRTKKTKPPPLNNVCNPYYG